MPLLRKSIVPRATLEQKVKILDFYHQSNKPQLVTVDTFKDKVAISTLTFYDWVKKEHVIRQQYAELEGEVQRNSRRRTKFKYERINRAMDLLVVQRLERGEPVTDPILREYWQVYAHQYGVENPKRLSLFSHGWLNQFKKRHGILKKMKAADRTSDSSRAGRATTSTNKEPLTGSNAERVTEEATAANDAPKTFVPEPVGLFQLQQAPNFALPYIRLIDEPNRSPDMSNSSSRSMTTPYYENTQETSPSVVMPSDFERFLRTVADPFFRKNQYDYPQTIRLYQELKSSFNSERLISLRSTQDEDFKVQSLQSPSSAISSHNMGMAETSMLARSMDGLSRDELAVRDIAASEHAELSHVYNPAISIDLGQVPRDIDQERQRGGTDFVENNSAQAHVPAQHRQTAHEFGARQNFEGQILRSRGQLLEQRQRENLRMPWQLDYHNSQRGHSQSTTHSQHSQRSQLQQHSQHSQHGQHGQNSQIGSQHSQLTQPGQHSQIWLTQNRRLGHVEMHRQDETSRHFISQLPRLSLSEPDASPGNTRTASSHSPQARLSITAAFSNSRDERGSFDAMFGRQGPAESTSFGEELLWSNKSELRKLWEQNKLLLS